VRSVALDSAWELRPS